MQNVLNETLANETLANETLANETLANECTKHATLEYLTNPLYYTILAKQKNENMEMKKNFKIETKFYRKRIIALVKDMLKDSTIKPTNSIRKIHDEYIYCLINYFKTQDRTDILQTQYLNEPNIDDDVLDDTLDDTLDDALGENLGSEKNELNELNINNANQGMMRKIVTMTTLDNFVINNSEQNKNDKKIIPIQKEVNLKCPTLKTKGIKNKKVKNE
jgi:hypothetical protein